MQSCRREHFASRKEAERRSSRPKMPRRISGERTLFDQAVRPAERKGSVLPRQQQNPREVSPLQDRDSRTILPIRRQT